ncbi:hypothetical protein BDN72DRAFT_961994 [Pluteus cervinus]|uniref:Uncharacterized protein n=1 Tax=Pluteus cervinus TaxID=181527 RepID=A0ACD3AJM3_9AGAR|nr:hypothetical protein BDN72DRAFT_961994 [Pluteus cervinus]
MADPTSCAHLPPELEHDIFLLAFQNDYRDATNLVLIAKRVFDWLIPHVLHVVQVDKMVFNQSIYQRYGHHVRHFSLDSSQMGDLRTYIALFPNVTNLAAWSENSQKGVWELHRLPLTRLSILRFHNLFPLVTQLTHLHVRLGFPVYTSGNTGRTLFPYHEFIKPLLHLPKLTHLCMPPPPTEGIMITELLLERKRCPELRALIIISGPLEGETVQLADDEPLAARDPRILIIRCNPAQDWEVGARGGKDMWEFADEILALRRK